MKNGTIVVIGSGVIGLSAALHIQEYLPRSQNILIVAREFPHATALNYASPWAGAHYRPVVGSSPQAVRENSQARRTYGYFKQLAAEDPSSGVQLIDGEEHLEAPPPEYLDPTNIHDAYAHLDDFRLLTDGETPAGVKWGARYRTFVVNPPVYCASLLRKFILNGGEAREYTLVDPMEAFEMADNVQTVVNCSGLGFGDPKSFIIRGQTCLVRNPCTLTLTRQHADGAWSFCIPRPLGGGTIIGGTKQPHDWNPHPSPATRATLLANAAIWFPFTAESGGKFDVVRDIVGRRPARDGGMRIEAEQVGAGRTMVHAYGVGGRGFELSWGVAQDVVQVMFDSGLLQPKTSL